MITLERIVKPTRKHKTHAARPIQFGQAAQAANIII